MSGVDFIWLNIILSDDLFNSLPLGDVPMIQNVISEHMLWIKLMELLVKLLLGECHTSSLMMCGIHLIAISGADPGFKVRGGAKVAQMDWKIWNAEGVV